MAFDTPDPCELICAAQVAALNAHEGFSWKTKVTMPDDPNGVLEQEIPDLQVMVFPFAESEEKIGRGGEVLETFETTLLVTAPLTVNSTRSRFFAYVREVRAFLRGLRMAGYVYVESETVSKLDLKALHERQRLVSVVRLSYRGIN